MKWFNELWLNEGFATWASHLAMFAIKDELLGGLNIWNHFINDNIERGMQFDSLKSTHKIACVVNNPDEIETIFDEISYSKGSSIIRMLEKWISPQCFQEGLRIYLNKFTYSNAVSNDLWDCLDQAFKGEDKVGDVMNPWIEREGFPYIKVEENGSSIVFKQERFTVGYDAVNEDPWPIPINVKWLDTDVIETYLMKEKTLEIPKYDSSSREEKGRFYKLNIEGSGFYRVFYSDHHFKELFKFKNSLNAKDLLNLVNDLWAFSYNDSIRFPIFLNEVLRFEDDYNVLYSTLINFFKLISLFYDDKNKRSVLYEKINYIVGDKLKNFTLSNENCEKLSLNERLKMALFIKAGIATESYEVKDKNIPFEFRKFFFKSQKDAEFEAIYDFYQTSTTPGLKEAALVGLTSTKDKDNFKKLCNVTVIPPHDSIYLFSGLASNINFRNEIMSYFVFNYSVIKNHVKEGNLLRAAVKYVLGNSLDESLEGPIKDFFKSHAEDSDIKSAVDYASRKYEINKSLRNKYKSRSLD
ncbi:AMP11 [Hepatospora eriocheir]|uniref:AMP11 n=1 Tax=Hepatospora eriocheir TaxID=1081669 RepID=A0A1X0QFD1_9MICR|nr:AMP11 [Hepatospora eriocheir]